MSRTRPFSGLWFGLALLVPAMSQAIEEPDYEVLRTLGDSVEIRRYAPYVVAEVLVDGRAEDAGRQAFPILAGYIFGKNKGERKFAMTAPVTQERTPVRLEMTAPVTQTSASDGNVVRFALPRGVTLATAPEPTDARVTLREVAGHTLAALRYSGFWSQSNDAAHFEQLAAALRSRKMSWVGEPRYARYNPPWTPWFLRRNEVWLILP